MFTNLNSQHGKSLVKVSFVATIICLSVTSQGCNASIQNALQGRQPAYINGHEIVVTDCYRLSKQHPETLKDAPDGSVHRFKPCEDADILLDHEKLTVNGKFYGSLNPGDKILVDHHKVFINEQSATEIASN